MGKASNGMDGTARHGRHGMWSPIGGGVGGQRRRFAERAAASLGDSEGRDGRELHVCAAVRTVRKLSRPLLNWVELRSPNSNWCGALRVWLNERERRRVDSLCIHFVRILLENARAGRGSARGPRGERGTPVRRNYRFNSLYRIS